MRAKMNRYGTFLMLLDRFKNHIFDERKRMKKLALFVKDVKKYVFFNETASVLKSNGVKTFDWTSFIPELYYIESVWDSTQDTVSA
jgi:hypothetical protein